MRNTPSLSSRFPNAAIVHANFAQFSAGQEVQYPCVKSRMVLWCKAGTGTVFVNKKACSMEAGRCLLLPWAHQIHYKASREDPFLLGGVHIIPEHAPDTAIAFTVAHDARHPLAHAPFRRDIAIPELAGLKRVRLEAISPPAHLLEYIVSLFVRSSSEEWMARQLARQLLCEWLRLEKRSESDQPSLPPELERMDQYIASHLRNPLSLRDLVEFSQLSPSTVGRMFREHLHTTPVAWILRMKMQRAKVLLRTRRITVAEVGEQVGIADPYYFSKCFKKETRVSPQHYRSQTVWI